jgi:hypothetical protein
VRCVSRLAASAPLVLVVLLDHAQVVAVPVQVPAAVAEAPGPVVAPLPADVVLAFVASRNAKIGAHG